MKKLFVTLFIGCIAMLMVENPALGQERGDLAMLSEGKPYFKTFTVPEAATSSFVNRKAVKDFRDRHANATSPSWYAVKGGFMTYFVVAGYPDRAFYDAHGRWQYSLLFYKEDKLPRDIRAVVKSTYYDCAITLVQEVQTAQNGVYLVYLEDAKTTRIVKVSKEGEMDTMEFFEKQ